MRKVESEAKSWTLEVPRSSRFSPPRLLQNQVSRTALVAQLLERWGCVNVLLGPPGGGRTVLMSECYEQLQEAQCSVYWLNLSPADNDLGTLEQHLRQALALSSEAPLTLANLPERSTLFIDGSHWLQIPEASALLQRFVLSVAAHSRVVLAASQLKAQALRSAELSGALRLFCAHQLRMSDHEAAELLTANYRLEQVRLLNSFVDGWPAGLRFLQQAPEFCAQLLKTPNSPPPLPLAFSDYLESHLCQILEPAHLNALMELGVLGRFTPDLLNALPEAQANWPMVAQYLREGWLLRYSDTQQQWLQLPAALSLYLSARLRQFNPERYKALRYFVAHWLLDHGHREEAARHAIVLDQPPVAAMLLEQAGAVALDLGTGPNVQLPELLPVEQAAQLPLLFIGQLYQRMRVGRIHEARVLFEQAWQLTAGFSQIQREDDSPVQSWAELYQCVFTVLSDRLPDAQRLHWMQREFERFWVLEPVLACSWGSLLAHVLVEQRQYANAIKVADIAIHLSPETQRVRINVFVLIHKAQALKALGRLDEAYAAAQQALDGALTDSGANAYEVVSASLSCGVLQRLRGDAGSALNLLLPALAQARETCGWAPLYAEGYATAVSCLAERGDFARAEALLHEGEHLAIERALPRLSAWLMVARLDYLRRAQRGREALALQQSEAMAGLLYNAASSTYETSLQVPALLASAQLLLELNRPREAGEYLARLDEHRLEQEDCRWQLKYHVLHARYGFAARRYSSALEQLSSAYLLARRSGLLNNLDLELHNLTSLGQWAQAHERSLPDGLFEWLGLSAATNTRSSAQLSGQLLSPRESEVLILVSEGLTNKEIANRLGISEGTVKGHRKRIHEKLGVSSRSQAISRARELLII